MLRRIEKKFVRIAIVADSATLVISFACAYWLRTILHFFGDDLLPLRYYAWVLSFIVPIFIGWLTVFGLYQVVSLERPLALIGSITKACAMGVLTVLSLLYMTWNPDVSRFVVDSFALMSVTALTTERLALRFLMNRRAMLRRKRQHAVLLVAEPEDVEAYLALLRMYPHWGIDVAAVVSPTKRMALGGVSVGGGATERIAAAHHVNWRQMLDNHHVEEVVTASEWSNTAELLDLQEACAERALPFRMLVTMPFTPIGHYKVEDVGAGRYLISLETVPQDVLALAVKRAMDIVGALVGLVVCGIVYLWYARRLRRESPGPVFFSHQRMGRNGRPFQCHKFRTMVVDAERMQHELSKHSKFGAVYFKVEDDTRIIPTGALMRRCYLDELPQCWNVLRGEMSLVGPRPSQPVEVVNYNDRQRRRLSMKPGLTGLFQIHGHRSVEDFDEVVRLDCKYIDDWSLWLDIKLLWRTVLKAARADGL